MIRGALCVLLLGACDDLGILTSSGAGDAVVVVLDEAGVPVPDARGGAADVDITPTDGSRPPPDGRATPSDDSGREGPAPDGSRPPPPDAEILVPDVGPPPGQGLLERLVVRSAEVPEGVARGATSWRIWGRGDLGVAPVFTVPLADCRTLVGFTTQGPVARVVRLSAVDEVEASFELARGEWLRGLAAEPDGSFGALLWDDPADAIRVARFSAEGDAGWSASLVNPDNRPDDFDIGDSRLEYGAGRYGAYYHVHSNSGHEGDTLQWVDAAAGSSRAGWTWGCSHSMSNVLRFHPEVGEFLPVCVTDCFPGTNGDFGTQSQGGIYINHRGAKVIDVDAGCNGSVAGELGSAAVGPAGWALVFNAHQAPMTPGQRGYDRSKNQDVGFASVGPDRRPGPVVWLTTTDLDEADPTIASWRPAEGGEPQFVVGWNEGGQGHRLARVDAAGAFLEGPVVVADRARWGRRDDPFRRHVNDDVVWAWFDGAGRTTLNIGRLRSGGHCP